MRTGGPDAILLTGGDQSELPRDIESLQCQPVFAQACAALSSVQSDQQKLELAKGVCAIVWHYQKGNKIREQWTRHPTVSMSEWHEKLVDIRDHASTLVELIGSDLASDLIFEQTERGADIYHPWSEDHAGDFPIQAELVEALSRIASRADNVAKRLDVDRKRQPRHQPSPELKLIRDVLGLFVAFDGKTDKGDSYAKFVRAVADLAGIEQEAIKASLVLAEWKALQKQIVQGGVINPAK
jgi:hypothetical protein